MIVHGRREEGVRSFVLSEAIPGMIAIFKNSFLIT